MLTLLFVAANVGQTFGQTARVQFIHASWYQKARIVDVYIDGVLRFDDFSYGSATPFIELPAGRFLTIDITSADAPDNSHPFHSSIVSFSPYASMPSGGRAVAGSSATKYYPQERLSPSRTTSSETFLIVLAGDPSSTNENEKLDLFWRSGVHPGSSSTSSTETIFFLAVPSPMRYNIHMYGAGEVTTVIDGLGFGEFSGRREVVPGLYDVEFTTADDSLICSFSQDYHAGTSQFVANIITGYDFRDGFIVYADGTTRDNQSNSAWIQFIHNSPFSSVDSVDIYVNDVLRVDNLAFREATPFVEIPARHREDLAPMSVIDVTHPDDLDNGHPLYTQSSRYESGQHYVSVLAGDPKRVDGSPMALFTYGQGRERASVEGFVDLLFFHSAHKVPSVAIDVEGMLDYPLVEHLDFGDFEGYKPLPPLNLTLLVSQPDHRKPIARVNVPLASMTLRDSAIVVLTSGFMGSEVGQSSQRGFKILAALPSGGNLISFEASIPKPWWTSLWFLALSAVALAGIAATGFQIRIRHLRARELELGTLVAERTKDLEAAKAQTEEQARRLTELDAAKNRFFTNISHEFRTPITLILGPLSDLRDGLHGRISGQARQQIELIRGNALRLLNLITQLLDLSRMDSGELELRVVKVDLIARLEQLVRSFTPFAERKRISLVFRHDVAEFECGSDPDVIEKIFGNLLSNAIKFTPEGGKVWVTVNLPDGANDSNVEVSIKDTGQGISSENLSLIFDRFASFDVDSRNEISWARTHEGIGIGLAVVKELVELLGGVIHVDSLLGFGSTFTVRLPLLPIPDEGAHIQPGEALTDGEEAGHDKEVLSHSGTTTTIPAATSGGSGKQKASVLIVEDNPDVRTYLRTHLDADYRVIEAVDGRHGLESAEKESPDLVIADVLMPVMDGYELCRALKAHERLHNVPVLMLTAKAGHEDVIEGLETGADDYIAKPFSMPELKARIANLITGRSRMRQQFSREVLVRPAGIPISSEEEVFLNRLLEVIDAHLGESTFGVESLANEVGISVRHMRRRVEEVTGESPAELIRRFRLERARQLLEADAATVAEVAYRVGFRSASHFSAIFREAYGVSPSEHGRSGT